MSRLHAYWKTAFPFEVGADREVHAPGLAAVPIQRSFGGSPIWIHPMQKTDQNGLFVTDEGDPFCPDDALSNVHFEHYVLRDTAGAARTERLRRLYYGLKPMMPRWLQLAAQRLNARSRLKQVTYPGWPQDDSLRSFMHAALGVELQSRGLSGVPFIGFWPNGYRWAGCFTHDVETSAGFLVVDQTAAIEEKHGIRSTWFVVPERYPVPMNTLRDLQARGHEVGVHGLNHDGQLFSSEEEFNRRAPTINRYLEEWGAVGFRSPALYRNAAWIPRLRIKYDSSFIDTAVLEPQFGGVSTVHPYLLGNNICELPITMPMDHHLINLLRTDTVAGMLSKFSWVVDRFGLANFLYHPDYNLSDKRLREYETVVSRVTKTDGGWVAPACDIADWWQRRDASRLVPNGSGYRIEGPASSDGAIWRACLEDNDVRIEPWA